MVAQATAMGYEAPKMTEHGVMWADEQDLFGHVNGATYARLSSMINYRVFESFGKTLGDRYDDLQRAEGVGVILKSQTIDLKHQVKYPDCVCGFLFCCCGEHSTKQYFVVAHSCADNGGQT
jgi:acyl-CoA thioesterase FadM